MHVTVVGTGYVGLVAGAGLADFGLHVVCVDKIREKIELLEKGIIPFYEPGLKELVDRNVSNGRLSFSTDLATSVRSSLVIFIAVGTPSRDDGTVDLSAVEAVAREIGQVIDDYKVVVTKSTVPVGTNRRIREIILEEAKNSVSVDVVSNPEFLREGSAVEDFMRPNRVVIGSDSEKALAIVKDIYRPLYLIETPFVVTNLETAEMIKYASNAFLATKISFINEVANLCEAVGADVHHVAKAMGLDKRIGPKFLHPGPGFGGSCFPKDTKAFVAIGREHNAPQRIVESVIQVNEAQKRRSIEKVKMVLEDEVQGKTVSVLGLSFKPNTSDIREAPSITLIGSLLEEGAKIRAFDPAAIEEFKNLFPEGTIYYAKDSYDAAEGADVLVVVTEWNEFRNLDLERLKGIMNGYRIVDLRNVYDPHKVQALGFQYIGVGRGA